MMNRSWIASLLVLALSPCVIAADEKADEKKEQTPPEKVVKAMLQEHYGTSSKTPDGQPHYRYTLQYASIKWGEPYVGNYRGDGVPANTTTTVYPVKADFHLLRETIYTGQANPPRKLERVVAMYGFFKDRFGDWTFRIKEQKREDVKEPPK